MHSIEQTYFPETIYSIESISVKNTNMHASSILKFSDPVRIPTIINYSNKTDYVLGKDKSIHLTCKNNGNPRISYYWYKENPKQQVSSNKNFTITNMNKTNIGIYTFVVNNTFYGNAYQKAAYVKIKIINAVKIIY